MYSYLHIKGSTSGKHCSIIDVNAVHVLSWVLRSVCSEHGPSYVIYLLYFIPLQQEGFFHNWQLFFFCSSVLWNAPRVHPWSYTVILVLHHHTRQYFLPFLCRQYPVVPFLLIVMILADYWLFMNVFVTSGNAWKNTCNCNWMRTYLYSLAFLLLSVFIPHPFVSILLYYLFLFVLILFE